jgi:competence ComEA-like helix-hairpin-helix protein
MHQYKLFICNIYKLNPKLFCLTFLVICLLFCLVNISCYKNNIDVNKLEIETSDDAIDLNTATAIELEKLPGIGKGLALRIELHREKFGKFSKIEQLILVRGISDTKFRNIRHLIKIQD